MHTTGVLGAIASGYLIFATTFGRAHLLRDVSVRIWGLSAPLGAFIAAWGGWAALASVPFDDWWHHAYGLDILLASPPHMLMALGFLSIAIGAILVFLAFMNRASGATRTALQWLFLYVTGLTFALSIILKVDVAIRANMHRSEFYLVVAVATPALLVAFAIASRHRWACAVMALVYTGFGLLLLWVLPLLPAQPHLGPVYRPVTHFIPWEFPLLVIVPAIALDLLLPRTETWRPLARALLLGAAFLGAFILVQWPFAEFLNTPAARNWFFGAHYFSFDTKPDSPWVRFEFYPGQTPPAFALGMLWALAMSWVMVWLGLHVGRGMQKVKR
jgi:hypothetical protein